MDDPKNGLISVQNNYDFINLEKFDFSWELLENGEKISSGNLPGLNIPSSHSKQIQISYPENLDNTKEYLINLYANTTTSTDLVPKGHTIAYEQLAISDYSFPKTFTKTESQITVKEMDSLILFTSGNFAVGFNPKDGLMQRLDYGYGNIIKKGVTPNFWRAPIDNDFGFKMPKKMGVWKKAAQNRELQDLQVTQENNTEAKLSVAYKLPNNTGAVTLEYLINGEGKVQVTTVLQGIKDSLPVLPRFGTNFHVLQEFNKVEWYGRGPHENYEDRKTSALLGHYESSVKELYFPYTRPQENGYKTDVRWVSFINTNGKGIQIMAPSSFGFSAHHQLNEDFDPGKSKQQRHTTDITERDLVNINVDHRQMGVGGDNSWGRMPHNQYQIKPNDMSFSYVISPIGK